MVRFDNSVCAPGILIENDIAYKNCEIHRNCVLQNYSYANNSVIRSHVHIGRFTSIGRGCVIGLGVHDYTSFTTSPFVTFSHEEKKGEDMFFSKTCRTKIGNDVWIGDHALIFSGVEIGDGAVVRSNVAPYEIVAGVPARHIRFRFSEEIRKKLLASRWWEFDLSTINNIACSDVEKFLYCLSSIASPRVPVRLKKYS